MTESVGPTPEAYSVRVLIRSQLDQLPPGERRVAELFLEQPHAALSWSAQDLARLADTSPATAVRACHRLGFAGLPALRLALARELGWTRLTVGEPVEGTDALLKAMLTSTANGLATIAEHVDLAAFRQAAEAVAHAERLQFVCSGPTQVVCQDAMFDLISIGRPVEFVTDSIAQSLSASKLRPGDVCVATGVSGSNELTVAAADAARRAGATLVAVTGFRQSELARMSDIALVVASPEIPEGMDGVITLVGMLLVLRALTRAVAQLRESAPGSPLMDVMSARRPGWGAAGSRSGHRAKD